LNANILQGGVVKCLSCGETLNLILLLLLWKSYRKYNNIASVNVQKADW